MSLPKHDTDKFLEALRIYLKNLRLEKGLSQVQLAQKGDNQHQSAIARLESGSSLNVGIRILYDVAKGLDVPLWSIIKQAEQGMSHKESPEEWEMISQQVSLLSPLRRKKFTKLVKDMFAQVTDN